MSENMDYSYTQMDTTIDSSCTKEYVLSTSDAATYTGSNHQGEVGTHFCKDEQHA